MMPLRTAPAFLAALALVLTACTEPAQTPATSPTPPGGDPTEEPTPTDQGVRPTVVATTTQVGAAAAEVGGELIELTVLLRAGADAHDFELTPSHARALEEADLILISGAGLETWLEDTLTTVGGVAEVRDMSEGIRLREPSDDEPTHGHEEDEHGHEEDEHGHDHGELDPHYWLTADNAAHMVRNVGDALTELVPEHAATFDQRVTAYVARLEAADEEIRGLIAEIPEERRKIVTNHDALGYFIDEYGLTFVGSIFPSLDVASEPSARQLAQLVDEIEREGVVAIFSESAVNPSLARTVANETGARVVEDPLYTDSLGPPGSGADTLDGMLLHNAGVIHAALMP